MSERIGSLADLTPGMIGFTNIGGFIPGLFPVKAGQLAIGESARIGRRSFDHVLICVEAGGWGMTYVEDLGTWVEPRAVQAMPRGAEEIELTPEKHWNTSTTWFRLPEDYPGQAEDAAAIARLFVSEKVPYSFLSYLALAAWSRGLKAERLARWVARKRTYVGPQALPSGSIMSSTGQIPMEAICSVLADQSWTLTGKTVMRGTRPQIVTPGALGARLINDPTVIRGGMGLL